MFSPDVVETTDQAIRRRRLRPLQWPVWLAVAGISGWLVMAWGSGERANSPPSTAGQYVDRNETPPGAGARPVELVDEGANYRVVRHAAGTTRVPANPQRICALACADELLSLGIKPVAHSIHDGNFPDYLAAPLAGVPWIPNVYGAHMPNMEAIIQVHPDLIITRTPSRQTYDQLSKIAPVVVLLDHLLHYRQRVLDVGTIVGRRPEAERRVAWYNTKVQAARDVLQRELGDRSMAVMRIRPKSYRLFGDQNHVSPLLYGDLQVKRPKLVAERSWISTMSAEDLLHLDADYLIITADLTPGGTRTLNDLLDHPVWRRLPAVKNDRVLAISKYRHWSDSGILGRARGIDDVLRAVAPDSVDDVNAQADAVLQKGGN
jgi:iron complex transport system substrate-binding protein